MSYAAKFVLNFLGPRIGKRAAKQIVYILLLAFGVQRKTINETFGASRTTLSKYDAAIKNEGLGSIFEQGYNRPQSKLEACRDRIFDESDKNPPRNRLS
jgi:hypothetical protein